ncbi:hypothetical protein [Amycolatopsis sp. M39]|uniref:hypothetical protein n=1 Tax=Amycolatopsis sp. M39 TaxID=1825094 RepID=UPI0007DF4442|nr:hypothetical protein [Amycolatopsis sp. M39]OAP26258.1 hypothetical protein A4R44_02245 [Amycolatopsis sp. M39]
MNGHDQRVLHRRRVDAAQKRLLAPAFADPDFAGPSLAPEPERFDPEKPAPVKGNRTE